MSINGFMSSYTQITVKCHDAANGGTRSWRISWHGKQQHRCCGQIWSECNEDLPPVVGYDSYGEPMERVSQCKVCGSLRSPNYEIREI